MKRFELRREALTVVTEAESEEDAVVQVVDAGLVEDGDVVSVGEAEERPIGWDGDDPEEGLVDVDHGDYA